TYPTTSQPALEDFITLYARLSQQAEAIVSIHVPQQLSGTCDTARLAADQAATVPVRVIDSGSAAMGQGMVVLAAARMAATGVGLEEVVAAAEAVIPRVTLLATLETLEHLRRGGRVRDILIRVGSGLRLHPILSLKSGHVGLVSVSRTRHRAIERILELMAEEVGDRLVHAAVFHADALTEATQMQDAIQTRFNCVELYLTEFTPVMGTHTGPGVVGITFYGEE
ncbi:MAG TPA: DegV family protein, partial [Anaerolineae bacterium]|nr:DegV family protein [Anaerolineae bacterium]